MNQKQKKIVIIGSGIAGLSSAYRLRQEGCTSIIIESQVNPGGLSQSFQLGKETFDVTAHVSFVRDEWCRNLLEKDVVSREFPFVAYNYKSGKWIKNPVQNNLYVLDNDEKIRIITDFVNRNKDAKQKNYKEWLRAAYGEYFSANYPDLYTRKYWTVEPEQLETEWVSNRMYRPSLEEVLRGAFSLETGEVHYTKSVRYPVEGGFQSYLNNLLRNSNAQCNKEIISIETDTKKVFFSDGEISQYDHLINTAPIKEIVQLVKNVSDDVLKAAQGLHVTSLVLVSALIEGQLSKDIGTFYIYDEDIPAARVYSTTKHSGNYKGVSAIQAEVYYSEYKPLTDNIEAIKEKVIGKLAEIGCYSAMKVINTDVRYIPYANIIFTPNIYRDRIVVRSFLEGRGIHCAGRFGEWDYLWTEQAMLSGKRAAEEVLKEIETERYNAK